MAARLEFAGNLYGGLLYGGGIFQDTSIEPTVEVGPVCGTPSLEYVVAGVVLVEGCDDVASSIIGIGNDVSVMLTGAYDEGAEGYLNAATVTFTVYGSNGTTAIAGPTAMTYIAASNGDYRGVLESSIVDALVTAGTMVPGNAYRVKVRLVSGMLDAEWDRRVPLAQRGWNC